VGEIRKGLDRSNKGQRRSVLMMAMSHPIVTQFATLDSAPPPPPVVRPEPVPSPVPLPSNSTATSSISLAAPVSSTSSIAIWNDAISTMAATGAAAKEELDLISSYTNNGISLDFDTTSTAVEYTNTPSVQLEASAVRARLHDYIQIGAVQRLPPSTIPPHGVQPLHASIKEGKKSRLVIDLSRNLKVHLRNEYFSYSNVDDGVAAATPGCVFGKLDLSKCFLFFPLHPDTCKYFYFRFEHELYRSFACHSVSAQRPESANSSSPFPSFILAQSGCPHVRYLDDFLFIANTKQELHDVLEKAKAIFALFGLVVNQEKTEGPLQQVTFHQLRHRLHGRATQRTPQSITTNSTITRHQT
jgi:hypothetical protein